MIDEDNITSILNRVSEYYGVSLMDKILDMCETEDISEQELGDILSESKEFKEMLLIDCVKHKSIQDDEFQKREERMNDLDIW